MRIVTYDGTFEGLLTVVFVCYLEKLRPTDIQVEGAVEKDFVSSYRFIKTEEEKADRVYRGIEEKISREALKNCYYAYLSQEASHSLRIYRYLRLGFQKGRDIDACITEDAVKNLHGLVQKVLREKHRMLGLTRFMELEDGTLYGKIQPKYNILGLIAPHFADRLGPERWMIHDEGRNLLVIGTQGSWLQREYNIDGALKLHQREAMFQSLWKEFHQSIAITERKNKKLQQQFMPKRYWKHLTEMQGAPPPGGEKPALKKET
ncbi:TIGR03915 family putative DNA repair protein [Isachenkonia alkalipeptolytica]|uniref:DNA metabolism protein n=1 Tax=Isachenkonia alkalipeptolytica TaxID=2565777 RepID=A0AA44BFP7_9CLOT|nr:TIGR03915 family putative DNA repair protein [Isachenkonia alkalipeptolytica]NBG88691.1 DNA metabolism protein [Isachenkonia alkalipeptolytica]